MAASLSRALVGDLSCPVCLELFKDPHVPKELDCPHILCAVCIPKMVTRGIVTCPECRHVTRMSRDGVTAMRTNLRLRNLADSFEQHLTIDEGKSVTDGKKDARQKTEGVEKHSRNEYQANSPRSVPTPSAPVSKAHLGNAIDKLTDMDVRTIVHKLRLTSNQLTNLYQELGLRDDEIENAVRSADTTDFKLQGSKVLRYWRSKKGNDATKGAILKAMKECDGLKEAMESMMTRWKIFPNQIC